jgi:hypothetical protein
VVSLFGKFNNGLNTVGVRSKVEQQLKYFVYLRKKIHFPDETPCALFNKYVYCTLNGFKNRGIG